MSFPGLALDVDRILGTTVPALLVLDFDGVLTDNCVYVDQHGTESVRCSRLDSQGLTLLRQNDFPVVILSSETNPAVARRAEKLKIPAIHGVQDKTKAFETLLGQQAIVAEQVVFVGNDVNDIGCLYRAGRGLAVSDAHPIAIRFADAVLSRPGGCGAVREVCDAILVRLDLITIHNPSDFELIRSIESSNQRAS